MKRPFINWYDNLNALAISTLSVWMVGKPLSYALVIGATWFGVWSVLDMGVWAWTTARA